MQSYFYGHILINKNNSLDSKFDIKTHQTNDSEYHCAWSGWPQFQSNKLIKDDLQTLHKKLRSNTLILDGEYTVVLRSAHDVYAQRDHTGIHPLYYRLDHKQIHFSDDPRQLINEHSQLNQEWVSCWLMSLYPAHLSPWDNIRQLPAGHQLKWRDNKVIINRLPAPLHTDHQENDLPQLVREHLHKAIKNYPDDAKPWACQLSGGMDSSSVISCLNTLKKTPGKALSYAFPHLPDEDETHLAQHTANFLALEWEAFDAENTGIYQNQSDRPLPFYSWDNLDQKLFQSACKFGSATIFTGHGGDTLFTGPGPERSNINKWNNSSLKWLRLPEKILNKQFSLSTLIYELGPEHGYSVFQKIAHLPNKPEWLRPKAARSQAIYDCLSDRYAPLDNQMGLAARIWNEGAPCIQRAIHAYNFQASKYNLTALHPLWSQSMLNLHLGIDPALQRKYGFYHGPKSLLKSAFQGKLPNKLLSNHSKPNLSSFYQHSMDQQKNQFNKLLKNSRLTQLGFINPEKCLDLLNHNKELSGLFPVIDLELWLQDKI